uniref:Uncharacterized protein n=1 Tax=Timema cristinae TaxID=61476 RepID=A0A7R9CVV9_TIMCR|nr:unnamed protein product [Timema cristinae]
MSMRVIVHRLLQNGRILLRSFKPYQNSRNVVDEAKFNLLPRGGKIDSSLATQTPGVSAVRNVGFNLHYHARRLFVDNVLRRVTNSLSADLRRRAAKRILFGDSAPFFALVGVSLASGTGLLTKDDELEGICWEIRQTDGQIVWTHLPPTLSTHGQFSLKDGQSTVWFDDKSLDRQLGLISRPYLHTHACSD